MKTQYENISINLDGKNLLELLQEVLTSFNRLDMRIRTLESNFEKFRRLTLSLRFEGIDARTIQDNQRAIAHALTIP